MPDTPETMIRPSGLLTILLVAACAVAVPPAITAQTRPAAPAQARPAAAESDLARWQRLARNVTITRDHWGIAHIRGRTDADAVFGMIYAQAEDDFNRVEMNFINAMGRLAEAEGEDAVYQDLRMKLFIDPDTLRRQYAESPAWLQALMNAWADGLNYYLHTHPEVKPRVITRFEPWMALSFSEGSIGGDIERISIQALEAFYSRRTIGSRESGVGRSTQTGAMARGGSSAPDSRLPTPDAVAENGGAFREPGGSNGFAIAPANTEKGDALLLINPHTSFYFRAEQQVTSEEGLNVYGAATWGQFFVYQGFNERLGWMHTSSGVDNVDEFLETIRQRGGRHYYQYGDADRPLIVDTIAVPYRTPSGMATRTFVVFRTHRGPIVRELNGQWVSVALMHRPVAALMQSYQRTKARSFDEYMGIMDLRANSSNNTIYADADGTIAYLHPQFVPRRDDRFDYTRPVDGSNPATDWKGDHALDELPFVKNPPNGWIQNTNNWPYSAAGPFSPKREQFPRYMDGVGENPRGIHAMMELDGRKDFTLERLRDAAYDSYLPAFAQTIPTLIAAYDAAPSSNATKRQVAAQIAELRAWDFRWDTSSVATTLAVHWGEEMFRRTGAQARRVSVEAFDFIARRTSGAEKLEGLLAASERVRADFGSWRTPWGEINRFQRRTGDIIQSFSDSAASIPVGFTSAQWGSLASFATLSPGTKRRYGVSGNSFVAIVEFGDRVRARAVSAGGESGHPSSPHFDDQAARYATGDLREVYFYPSQLTGKTERVYRPGQR